VIVDDVIECQHAVRPLWIVDDWVERVAGVRVEEGFRSLGRENLGEDEVLPYLADSAEVAIRPAESMGSAMNAAPSDSRRRPSSTPRCASPIAPATYWAA